MKLSDIIGPLLDAKVDHELIRQQIMAFEKAQGAATDASKEKARARWRKWKSGQDTTVSKRLPTVANDSCAGDARVEDITSNLDIEPQKEERKKRATSALLPAFDEFWSAFPNKAGKRVAFAAYVAATKRADHPEIMAGLRRYVASKPADRPWLNPATFLNQDRWADEPAVVPVARGSPAPRKQTLSEAFAEQNLRQDDDYHQPVEPVVFYLPAAAGRR